MKKINIVLSLGFLAVILLSSCGKNGLCVRGSGPEVSENRLLASFNKVTLDVSADIYLMQDSVQSVSIKAQKNILDILETEVSNGRLTIDFDRHCVKNHEPIKIYITVPDIRAIDIDGSGDIIGMGPIVVNELNFDIDGSGSIQIPSVTANSIGINISGSGDATFGSESTVEYFDINIDGSGDIKAFGLPANHVSIDIDGSGDARVHALQTLNVKISGSGNVYYIGYPDITTNISGSGDIISSN